jgi:hypothetical protein
MDDERDPRDDAETGGEAGREIVHDDIVKRLLDYQRQLREVDEAPAAATTTITAQATATEEIVDLTDVEGDGDTISLDEPATEAAMDATESAPMDAAEVGHETSAGADEGSADVIVLHPEPVSSDETADTASMTGSVDATADEDLATAVAEIATGETDAAAAAAKGAGTTASTTASPAIETAAAPVTDDAATASVDDERIARYQRSLEDLAERFAILRSTLQDMAIAADERLAEIEELLEQTQLER